MWVRATNQKLFTTLLVALIATTWLALTIWCLSPYAAFLNHRILEELHFSVSGEYLALLLIFVAGWILMTIAMMLPTSLPLVTLFQRLTRHRPDHSWLVVLLIAGYLGVWMLFGTLAHFGDLLVHEVVHRFPWLEANAWAPSAGVLAVGGLYQFTPLKYACLESAARP